MNRGVAACAGPGPRPTTIEVLGRGQGPAQEAVGGGTEWTESGGEERRWVVTERSEEQKRVKTRRAAGRSGAAGRAAGGRDQRYGGCERGVLGGLGALGER